MAALLLAGPLLGGLPTAAQAADRSKVAYVPGVALTTEVLLADGKTQRTYNTPKGLSYWQGDLPIPQGDTMKITAFVATGGAELGNVKIRVDNAKIADLTQAPWAATLDTATLAPGYHMLEVWAQTSGDRPQASSKTLSFYVTKELSPEFAVKGSQQSLQNGTLTTENPVAGDADAVPPLPDFLRGKPVDANARVELTAQQPQAAAALKFGSSAITIAGPTVLYARAKPGSKATQYAFVLARDGASILTATRPLALGYQRINIQKRTETTPGLRPGTVVLWVWGMDAAGHPGAPIKTVLDIQ